MDGDCRISISGAGVFVWASDAAESPPTEDRWPWLHDCYAGAPPTIQGVIDDYPGNGAMYMDPLFQTDMPCWHRGRAVPVGDAAHCMTGFPGAAHRFPLSVPAGSPKRRSHFRWNRRRPVSAQNLIFAKPCRTLK